MNYIIRITVSDCSKAFYAKNIDMEKDMLQKVLNSVVKPNYKVEVLTGKKNHHTVVKGLENLIKTVSEIRFFKKAHVRKTVRNRYKICKCMECPFTLKYVDYLGITVVLDYNSRVIEDRDSAIENILGKFFVSKFGNPYVWGHYMIDGNTVYQIVESSVESVEIREL
jgi:hypothetical protein